LHAGPERLDNGVVVAVSDRAHRRHETGIEGTAGERPGRELCACGYRKLDSGPDLRIRRSYSDRGRASIEHCGRTQLARFGRALSGRAREEEEGVVPDMSR
jgi:hypothetical protein